MAHENSITLQNKQGAWENISGNVKGKFNRDEATRLYNEGKRKSLDGRVYKTSKDAVAAAKTRSNSYKSKKKKK